MKKVKIVRLTDAEKKELKEEHEKQENPQKTYEEILKENNNVTLVILRNVIKFYEWDGPDKMVEFVGVMNKFREAKKDEVELDNDQFITCMDVFKVGIKNASEKGLNEQLSGLLERIVDVYSKFKLADSGN